MDSEVPIGRYVSNPNVSPPARYVRITAVAGYTGLSVRHLHDLTRTGTIPHIRVGRVIVYDLFAIDAWMAAQATEVGSRRAKAAKRTAPIDLNRAGKRTGTP